MSDNALDIIVYIALTLGASAIGALKSSKDKKKRMESASSRPAPRPEIFAPDVNKEEERGFFDEMFGKSDKPVEQEAEQNIPEPVLVEQTFMNKEISESIRRKGEEALAHFGRSDEERIQILMNDRQARKKMRDQRFADLFKMHENDMADVNSDIHPASAPVHFDIREAVIASEILTRKY